MESTAATASPTAVDVATSALALPEGMAAGRYRLVNHRGEVRLVVVAPTAANQGVPSRDFHIHDIDGERWYLIRLDSPMTAANSRPGGRH